MLFVAWASQVHGTTFCEVVEIAKDCIASLQKYCRENVMSSQSKEVLWAKAFGFPPPPPHEVHCKRTFKTTSPGIKFWHGKNIDLCIRIPARLNKTNLKFLGQAVLLFGGECHSDMIKGDDEKLQNVIVMVYFYIYNYQEKLLQLPGFQATG